MIRQLLDVVKHLMTDITLRLPLTHSAPVYLDLVCLDIVDCCQLRLPDSLLGCLLGRLPSRLAASWDSLSAMEKLFLLADLTTFDFRFDATFLFSLAEEVDG